MRRPTPPGSNPPQYKLEELPDTEHGPRRHDEGTLLDRQQAFGFTQEDVSRFLEPMAQFGDDPIGSMGTDTPIAVLSQRSRLLYDYFKQNFAQVTNPPIDPIREELVMSLVSMIGPRPNLLGRQAGAHKRLEVSQPVLTDTDLAKIRSISETLDGAFRTETIDITWPASDGAEAMERALERVCNAADRGSSCRSEHPCPVRSRGRARSHRDPGRACDGCRPSSPDPPRPAHADRPSSSRPAKRAKSIISACWRVTALKPSIRGSPSKRLRKFAVGRTCRSGAYEVQKNYIKAIGKGIFKVMSKMGISTYQSYCGAQIFDAIGLSSAFVDKYFTRHRDHHRRYRPGEIADETVRRHRDAFGDSPLYRNMLDVGGNYAFRIRGEEHAWTPTSVAKLQHAVRGNISKDYAEFAASINEQSARLLTMSRPDGTQESRYGASD